MQRIVDDLIDLLDITANALLRYILPVVGVLAIIASIVYWDGTELSKTRMVWSVGLLVTWLIIRVKFLNESGGKNGQR